MRIEKAPLALQQETARLAAEISSGSFGALSGFNEDYKKLDTYRGARATVARMVSDGAVSDVNLTQMAGLLAIAAELAQGARVQTAQEIRTNFVNILRLDDAGPIRRSELRAVPKGVVTNVKANDQKVVDARRLELSTLTALHGAIQAQHAAQPAITGALEFIKDNAELLGVTAALADAQSTVEQVVAQTQSGVEQVVAQAKDFKSQAEGAVASARTVATATADAVKERISKLIK